MNTAVPGHANRRRRRNRGEEVLDRNRARDETLGDDAAAGLPRRHDGEDTRADQNRQPSALEQLQQVGAEEGEVDRQEDRRDRKRQRLGHRHRSTAMTCSSTAVITIVIVTAIPYAAASALDDRSR
jgi:hypothetical protein